MQPQKKYASIITILHNMEDLSTMTPGIVIGKIVAFEMSCKMGQEEASLSSKGKAVACSEKRRWRSSKLRQAQAQAPQVKMKKKRMMMMIQVMMINLPPPPPTLMKNQSNLSTRWRRRWSKGSMSRVCPSKFKISSSPIKEMSKERKDAMDAVSWGTLWKFVQTSPHPRQRRRRVRTKPSHQ